MDKVKSALSATTSFSSQVLDNLESEIKSRLPSQPSTSLSKIATSIAAGLEKVSSI